jgi:hypothetical protein
VFIKVMMQSINMQTRFSDKCPTCGGSLAVRHLACVACGLKLEGEVPLPNLARLGPEQREFVEVFVVCGGSLKDAGQVLGVSYPTVRSRLDQAIAALKALRGAGTAEEARLGVLERLERGEITAKEAATELRLLNR